MVSMNAHDAKPVAIA